MNVSCQCDAVAFTTATPKPITVYCCHCTECRKQSSSAFGISARFPAADVFPLSDTLRARLGVWSRPSDSGTTVDCYFCQACGVRVFHRIRDRRGERPTVNIKGGLVE